MAAGSSILRALAKARLTASEQRKLVALLRSKIEEIPEAWRVVSPKVKLAQEQLVKEELKLKEFQKNARALSKKAAGKAVVGGAVGGTLLAMPDQEAEAAVNPKGMWEILGRELKKIDTEKLLSFFQKTADDFNAVGKSGNRGEAFEKAYLKKDIVSAELESRLSALSDSELKAKALSLRESSPATYRTALKELSKRDISLDTGVQKDPVFSVIQDMVQSRIDEKGGLPPGVDFNVIPGGGQTTPRKPGGPGPRGLGLVGAAAAGAAMTGTAEAQPTGLRAMMGNLPSAAQPAAPATGLRTMLPWTAPGQDVTSGSQVPTQADPPFDDPNKEDTFQRWYSDVSKRLGLNPNPDDPLHQYNYRRAWEEGVTPPTEQGGHWPSKYKLANHLNRYVNGEDTITGARQPFQFPPPLPGSIPQEDVAGYDTPEQRVNPILAAGKTMLQMPGTAIAAGATGAAVDTIDFGGDIVNLLSPGQPVPPGTAATLGLRGMHQRLIERMQEQVPTEEAATAIRDLSQASGGVGQLFTGGGAGKAVGRFGKGLIQGKGISGAAAEVGREALEMTKRGKAAIAFGAQLPRAPATYGKVAATPEKRVAGLLNAGLQRIGRIRSDWFNRPGSHYDLGGAIFGMGAKFKGKEAKDVLRYGLPELKELGENTVMMVHTGFAQKAKDLAEISAKAAGGDLSELDKMNRLLRQGTRVGAPVLNTLDPEVRKAFEAATQYQDDAVEALIRQSGATEAQANALRKSLQSHTFKAFEIARYNVQGEAGKQLYLGKVRGTDEWNALETFLRGIHPDATTDDIAGEMEDLLGDQVVKQYHANTKFGKGYLENHPLWKEAIETTEPKKIDRLVRKFYGEVDTFSDSYELAARMIAEASARYTVGKKLIDRMAKAGLAAYKAQGGMTELPDGSAWVINELSGDALDFTKNALATVNGAMAQAANMWRFGMTVGSVTSAQVMNPLSNVMGAIAKGNALQSGFWIDLLNAVKQSASVVGRGVAREEQAFERGLAMQGMGPGSLGGELQVYGRRPGIFGSVFGDPADPGFLKKNAKAVSQVLGRAFSEGDIVFKRAILPRSVSEWAGANPTLKDRAALMELYGTDDPLKLASNEVSDLLQTYSRVPEGWRKLSRNPYVGVFVSFPVEMTRNIAHSWGYLAKEMQMAVRAESPELRNLMIGKATRRVAGIGLSVYGLPALTEMWEAGRGYPLSKEQKEVVLKRGVPRWDKGEIVILDKKFDRKTGDLIVTYSPASRADYFDKAKDNADFAMTLVSDLVAGRWNKLTPDTFEMMAEMAGTFLPFQEPFGTLIAGALNARIDDSPIQTAVKAMKGEWPKPIIQDPRPMERLQAFGESAYRSLTPTAVKQVVDLATGNKTPREVSPIGQVHQTNLLRRMRDDAYSLHAEKQSYHAAFSRLRNDKAMSAEDKRAEVLSLKKRWDSSTAPRILAAARDWDKLFPRYLVIREMGEQLGAATVAVPMARNRNPDFYMVFSKSIPPEALRR